MLTSAHPIHVNMTVRVLTTPRPTPVYVVRELREIIVRWVSVGCLFLNIIMIVNLAKLSVPVEYRNAIVRYPASLNNR